MSRAIAAFKVYSRLPASTYPPWNPWHHSVEPASSGACEFLPLVREPFEAWDYGPVVPGLYHRVKPFGSGPVGNVFHWVDEIEENTADYRALQQAEEGTRHFSPGQLVAITHRNGGAWARHYLTGARGVVIPNEDILREYRLRSAEGAVA